MNMRYVAFLRGINVSGQKLIKMQDLKSYFEMPGFKNVVTYIQSGNVLFDSAETESTVLNAKIEKALKTRLGYEVPTIVRSVEEMKLVVANNPFEEPIKGEKIKLYVCFLSGEPDAVASAALEALNYEKEQVRVVRKEVYLVSEAYGSTKFPNTLVEKRLGFQSTVRNWNTVNKVLEL